MAISISPCYKCTDKFIGCHGQCERYLDWVAEKQEINKVMQNQDRQIREYKIKRNQSYHEV